MDLTRACNTLNIKQPFDFKTLKKHYYKAALQYHPDKNVNTNVNTNVTIDNDNGSKIETFQEVHDAYTFLSMWLEEDHSKEDDLNYSLFFQSFIEFIDNRNHEEKNVMNYIMNNLIDGYRNLSVKAFENIDKEVAIKLFSHIARFSQILGLDESTIIAMREILNKKMCNDELVVLNPSIDNLLKKDVYKLEHNGECFYVPLWHDEISYDISGSDAASNYVLVVKCIPDIDKHIHIDEFNVLHVNVSTQISKVLQDGCINVYLGEKVFEILSHELKIQQYQTYTLKSVGIPIINTHNMYNVDKKSDIVVNITLTK
tara:strand:- start:57 stop:998 length:942 start_codon:yes stop_codon:yes gene_type:complete